MSGVFYPGNLSRRDRAVQLSNDITLLQNSVKEARTSMDKADKRMVASIDELLRNHNMSTFTELQNRLLDTLTPDQKKAYQDLVKSNEAMGQGTDTALMAMSAICLVSGVASKAIDLGMFLTAGHVIATFRAYARAFVVLVTDGLEAGRAAFRIAAKGAEIAGEALKDASKLARYAATAGRILKVVAVLGVVADAFILGLSIYEEHKQMEELDGAISKLYVARITAKFFARMCDAIKTQDGLMLGYLVLVSDTGTVDPDLQVAADKITNKLISFVTEDWKAITAATSLDLLVVLDKSRDSWTDEDPGYDGSVKAAEDDLAEYPVKKGDGGKPGAPSKATVPVEESAQSPAQTLAHSPNRRPDIIRQITSEAHDNFQPFPTVQILQMLVHLGPLSKDDVKSLIGPNAW